MKKGFSLIELLAVIAILGIIVGISVPVYLGVSSRVKQSIYETKLENIKAASEVYASDTNVFVLDVKTLIENGRMEADNELGEYIDPTSNRDMRCDIVNVTYNDGNYEATVTPSNTCYESDELENMYGLVHLTLYKDKEGHEEITKYDDTDWTSDSPVYVRYSFNEKYKNYSENILSVTWSGENEYKCTSNNISECAYYEVNAETIKNVGVNFEITVLHDEVNFTSRTSTRVMIDKQSPIVEMATLSQDSEVISQKGKKVEVDVSDGNGSGPREYSLVSSPNCDNATYIILNNNRITEYLFNGIYYICLKDKVGNRNSDIESTKFEVKNVDDSIPVIDEFSIKSKDNYDGLNTVLTIKASKKEDESSSNLKMCISNTGLLKDCSWEDYHETKDWTLKGSLDGGVRTVYLSILDEAGNVASKTVTYTVYRECSKTTKNFTSGWSGCSASCGGGTQTRSYAYKDNYTGKTCSTGTDSQKCNTMDCCSSVRYVDGSSCTVSCGGGTKNRVAYSSYNGQRCSSKDQSSGGSACNTKACTVTYGSNSFNFYLYSSDMYAGHWHYDPIVKYDVSGNRVKVSAEYFGNASGTVIGYSSTKFSLTGYTKATFNVTVGEGRENCTVGFVNGSKVTIGDNQTINVVVPINGLTSDKVYLARKAFQNSNHVERYMEWSCEVNYMILN